MAYSHKQNGPNLDIYREDVHIATYDPVEDETTFAEEDFKRFSKHVVRHIKKLNDTAAEEEEEPAAEEPAAEEEEPAAEEEEPADVKTLNREILRLRMENVKLQDEVSKLRGDEKASVQNVPERFADEFDDSEGKELKNPHMGDLTPKYVEWARENMPKEIFEKRYRGRLPKTK